MSDCRRLCGFHTICSSIVKNPWNLVASDECGHVTIVHPPWLGSAGCLPLRVPHMASDLRWLPHSQAWWPMAVGWTSAWAAIRTLHIVADTCCLLGFRGVSRAGEEVWSTFCPHRVPSQQGSREWSTDPGQQESGDMLWWPSVCGGNVGE